MSVLVDTSVWSMVLRRGRKSLSAAELALRHELTDIISSGNVVLIGPIRQEILSGIRERSEFERVQSYLRWFADEPLTTDDYETAAEITNRCLRAGLRGAATDLLICAAAIRRGYEVFTVDTDFRRYASEISELRLYEPK